MKSKVLKIMTEGMSAPSHQLRDLGSVAQASQQGLGKVPAANTFCDKQTSRALRAKDALTSIFFYWMTVTLFAASQGSPPTLARHH